MEALKLQNKLKKNSTAIILAIFGLHYLYLGKYGTFILFVLTGGGFGFWYFIDLFRASGMVDNYNEPIYTNLRILELENNSK